MKGTIITSLLNLLAFASFAQASVVYSPDKQLKVSIQVNDGLPAYSVTYKGKTMLDNSPLGLQTDEGDFSTGMKFLAKSDSAVEKNYTQDKIKVSEVHYVANVLSITLENARRKKLKVIFQVSNNNIAFRYELPVWGKTRSCVVEREATGFKFPSTTTTFLSTNMKPASGYAGTTPSYETPYEADAPMRNANPSKEGYIFPGLFRIGESGWVLVSETGVSSLYCASHLSELSSDGIYSVEFPNPGQNNNFGSTGAAISLPGVTPWRTLTVADNLKPIVETTIPFDIVEPLYEASQKFRFGRGTWSWIVWQNESMNYQDQVKFIDLAAELKYEYILIDAFWDSNIGKERMCELIKYANSKGVDVMLWYNSNGAFNDAPEGPRDKMNSSVARKKEMKWLREVGVKGLKVDFFGGDKQETMRLYEDILSDANDYGLMVVFHGTTIPRGWERMYPNYVGSEAVLASEMLVFDQNVRNREAFNASMHPFIRNAVGCMEFGGTFLNKYLVKSNTAKNARLTTDAFQLATAVLFQNPVQMFALTPNNLSDAPAFAIQFMKQVPTTWDETVFLDGYPGKYCVLARRNGNRWFVTGVNAGKEALKLKLNLPMFSGKKVHLINDDKSRVSYTKETIIPKKGHTEIEMQPGGGILLSQ